MEGVKNFKRFEVVRRRTIKMQIIIDTQNDPTK